MVKADVGFAISDASAPGAFWEPMLKIVVTFWFTPLMGTTCVLCACRSVK